MKTLVSHHTSNIVHFTTGWTGGICRPLLKVGVNLRLTVSCSAN